MIEFIVTITCLGVQIGLLSYLVPGHLTEILIFSCATSILKVLLEIKDKMN